MRQGAMRSHPARSQTFADVQMPRKMNHAARPPRSAGRRWLDYAEGRRLRRAFLGCGRGGPGLWLAQQAGAALVGVDLSPVAVDQAAARSAAGADQLRRPARRSPVPALDSRSLPSGHRHRDRPRLTARSRNPAVTAGIEIKRVDQQNVRLACYAYFEKLVSASEGVSRL